MDEIEFTNVMKQHSGLIYKVAAAYCRQASDRADVMQEIMLQLWRARASYNASFQETTWIYRIALNVAISFYRRQRRHNQGRVSVEPALVVASGAQEPEGDLERLLQCIHELKELDRALVLMMLDGQDHQSIASVLGISVSNVGTKLHRIKSKLRAVYDQRTNPRE